MDSSTPGFPVHHQFPELAQTHVRQVSNAIQPSHPLSSPSPAFNLSQHQGLFKSGDQSIGVSASASVLPMNIQDWFPLGLTGLTYLQSKGLSRVFSTPQFKSNQFFGTHTSLWSNSHIRGDFPGGSDSKASVYNAGDPGLIPGSGRSSGEGNGNPLQNSCLENPMDGEAC